ncbi:MAG TPA: DciA family protein [Steroidobacteraceae bacterium]|nr:DciA family protein [Steroidobacteraceae bacterium]
MSDALKPLFGGLTPKLDVLARKAKAAQTLTEKVRLELAEQLRPHLVSASRRGADLVVIMDSAAWTPRVRYAARSLKARLEQAGEPEIGKVSVKVRGKRIADRG